MRKPEETIDIPTVIDANRVGAFQIWILVLVGLTVVIDGFDVQAMGFVAPAIIDAWGVDKASLGPVFGAGLLGMLLGSLFFGWATASPSLGMDQVGLGPVAAPAAPAAAPALAASFILETETILSTGTGSAGSGVPIATGAAAGVTGGTRGPKPA